MYNKAVDNYPDALEFVPECCKIFIQYSFFCNTISPECYKTEGMCYMAFNECFLAFIYIPNWYKSQEMYDRVISKNPFSIRYVPNQYKIQ